MLQLWYEPEPVCLAWKNFVTEADKFKTSSLFRRDLVDVSRQVLQLVGGSYYGKIIEAFQSKNIEDVEKHGAEFIQLMTDLDQILLSDDHFLLGTWISSAKKSASSKSERALLEYNSRNQVTLWGPNGEILDYARKQWGGLIEDYYKQRWALFIKMISQSLQNGTEFDQNKFENDVFLTVEKPFCEAHTSYLSCVMKDSIDLAKNLFNKYFSDCKTVKKVDADRKKALPKSVRYGKQSKFRKNKS